MRKYSCLALSGLAQIIFFCFHFYLLHLSLWSYFHRSFCIFIRLLMILLELLCSNVPAFQLKRKHARCFLQRWRCEQPSKAHALAFCQLAGAAEVTPFRVSSKHAAVSQGNRRGHPINHSPSSLLVLPGGYPPGTTVAIRHIWNKELRNKELTLSQWSAIAKNGLAVYYRATVFPPQHKSRAIFASEVNPQINKSLSRAKAE